jgi:choline dehydrogenase
MNQDVDQNFAEPCDLLHQSSTAKMGRHAVSVVDGQLKVYGVDAFRVTDASIMPRVTRGNTMAPCVVIGEQGRGSILTVGRVMQITPRNR